MIDRCDRSVRRIGALTLRNPVMPASGTFAEGLDQVIDFNRLGAFVTKTITRELRAGNPLPARRRAARQPDQCDRHSVARACHYFIDETLPHYAGLRRRRWWSASRRRPRKASPASRAELTRARRRRDRGQHLLPEYRGGRQGLRHAGDVDRSSHRANCARRPRCRSGSSSRPTPATSPTWRARPKPPAPTRWSSPTPSWRWRST